MRVCGHQWIAQRERERDSCGQGQIAYEEMTIARIEWNAKEIDVSALARTIDFNVRPVARGEGDQLKISTPMSANRPALPYSYEILRFMRNGGGAGRGHAKPNDGSIGGSSASVKPISESSMLKRIRSRGCSGASGVDSKEEDVDSTPCVWRLVRRGGVLGAIDRAANWFTGRPMWD